MSESELLPFKVVAWTTNTLTVSAATVFFFSFARLPEKDPGLHMILILGISNFMYPFLDIVIMGFLEGQTAINIVGAIEVICFHFSLYWTVAIAIFVFLIFKNGKAPNPRSFNIYGLFICL